MNHNQTMWAKKVFRLRGLPNTITTLEGVASLLCSLLDSTPLDTIHVFSLAASLNIHENPPSKVATVMFDKVPSVIRDDHEYNNEWLVSATTDTEGDLTLDTHFLGMTPLNDSHPDEHLYE